MGARIWTYVVAAAVGLAASSPTEATAAQRGRSPEIAAKRGSPDPGRGPRHTVKGDEARRDEQGRPAIQPRVQREPASQKTRTDAEPAFAAGYADGYSHGMSDGTDGQRYDPVRHSEYRDAERGYRDSYGSRDAYRTNYRTGFRQGYEEGYRLGTRNRR